MKINKNGEAFKKVAEHLKKKRDERLDERDSLHLDPDERANLIMTMIFRDLELESVDITEALKQPLFSDLLSFSIGFIGIWAMTMGDDGLSNLVKKLSRTHYTLHYSYPDGHEALGPHREEHERIWRERINRKLKD